MHLTVDDNNFGSYPADDYTQKANEETWILIQIESPSALPHVREIAEIEGVDGIFFGPGDFSLLSGKPGQIKDAEVLKAAEQVAQDALAAGKVFGTLVFDRDHSKFMQDAGRQLLIHGADILFYKSAYTNLLTEYTR